MRRIVLLVTWAGMLSGCASHGTMLRWSAETGVTGGGLKPELDVSSQPSDPPTPLTAKTLPERASAAYITALAVHQSDPDKLRTSMAKPIRKTAESDDPTKVDRVLVISVQRKDIRPADRFVRTWVEIKPTIELDATDASKPPICKEQEFVFFDYQSASTSYETINIGTVSITNQVTSSASITPTLSMGSAGLSLGATNTDASTRNITDRTQLSVNVKPTHVDVIRTGTEGQDLLGNTLVKLAVQLPEGKEFKAYVADPTLMDKDNQPLAPAKASLKLKAVRMVDPEDLEVCAKLSYVDRVVSDGSQFRDEGRQSVNYVDHSTNWERFPIVSKAEREVPLWFIGSRSLGSMMEADTGMDRDSIALADYDTAVQFLTWLKKYKTSKVGKYTVGFELGGTSLSPAPDFEALEIIRRLDQKGLGQKTSSPSIVCECPKPGT